MTFRQELARLGDALVFANVSRDHDHVVARALWRDKSGRFRPAFVRECFFEDERNGPIELTARLRLTLGPALAPAVFAAYGRGRRVLGWVEEDLGGLELRALLRHRSDEPFRLPVALHAARQMATAWQRVESRAPGQTMILAPSRVRIGWDGRARLLGEAVAPCARAATVDDPLALDFPRSIDWVAPETLRGLREGPRTSMYAVGLMLFEAIVGTFPFRKAPLPTFLRDVMESGAPRLASIRPDLPTAVAGLVDGCTARDPAERFASWPALLDALAEAEASMAPFDAHAVAAFLATLPERAAADRRHAEVDVDSFAALQPGLLHPVALIPLGPRAEDTLTAPLPWMTADAKPPDADP
jgi:hypothetical protein